MISTNNNPINLTHRDLTHRDQGAGRGLAAVDEAHDLGVAVERHERVEVGDRDRAELEGERGGLM